MIHYTPSLIRARDRRRAGSRRVLGRRCGGGGIAAGYRHGFIVAAVAVGGLAVVAALLVPAVRPAVGARVAVH